MMKVRFAPSPTGYLHIGGARTALFNWMYARSQKGQFLLRIEDTDLVRSKKEYEEEILEALRWLGMDWDEIQYQSKRFDIYHQHAEKLVSEGKAYKDGQAVLFKTPKEEVKFFDLIRGEIRFDTSNFTVRDAEGKEIQSEEGSALKDEVLIKNDGSPAFTFCNAVDDALMGITHVIRGEDHISNTPKQILIYKALGYEIPKFAHLPLIMGEDGGRLSKRHGAVAVTDYRKKGFLPDALVNYLMLLGWSPGADQEIISMKNALQKFSIKKINKAAAVFSWDKLSWINSQYIKNKTADEIVELLIPFLKEKGYIKDAFDRNHVRQAVSLYQSRMPTLNDFLERADFVFIDDFSFEEGAREKYLKADLKKEFAFLVEKFSKLESFDVKSAEETFRLAVAELGLKTSDLVHPVRVALTGKTIGPGLFDTIVLLGKQKSLERLKKYSL